MRARIYRKLVPPGNRGRGSGCSLPEGEGPNHGAARGFRASTGEFVGGFHRYRSAPQNRRREWTLLAGGDVLTDRTVPAGIDLFEFIEPALASADSAVVNVEMAISDRGALSTRKTF